MAILCLLNPLCGLDIECRGANIGNWHICVSRICLLATRRKARRLWALAEIAGRGGVAWVDGVWGVVGRLDENAFARRVVLFLL